MNISFVYDENDAENMDIIKAMYGIKGKTQSIRFALAFTARKAAPAYTQRPLKERQDVDPVEREIKKREKVNAEKEARKMVTLKECRALVEKLNGTEHVSADGFYSVKYLVYEILNPNRVDIWEEETSYDKLSNWHVEHQYREGTKKQIEQMVAEGKGKYI